MKISKTAIFLFELMFVILVFSVSAAICSDIFAKAYKFSSDSKDLTTAVLKAESVAEEIKADVLSNTTDEEKTTPVYAKIYYDKDWQDSSEGDSVYTLTRSPSWHGDVLTVIVQVDRGDEHIYDITVQAYGGQ